MAKTALLPQIQTINNAGITITSADATTPKLLFTAGANDSVVNAIAATSNDTASVTLQLFRQNGGTNFLLGTVGVATLSGTNGVAASVDLLSSAQLTFLPIDGIGKRFIALKFGDSLYVAPLITMTASKTVTVSAFGGDY